MHRWIREADIPELHAFDGGGHAAGRLLPAQRTRHRRRIEIQKRKEVHQRQRLLEELSAIAEGLLQRLLASPCRLGTQDDIADRDGPGQRPEHDEHPDPGHRGVREQTEARAPHGALPHKGVLASQPLFVDLPKPGYEVVRQAEQPHLVRGLALAHQSGQIFQEPEVCRQAVLQRPALLGEIACSDELRQRRQHHRHGNRPVYRRQNRDGRDQRDGRLHQKVEPPHEAQRVHQRAPHGPLQHVEILRTLVERRIERAALAHDERVNVGLHPIRRVRADDLLRGTGRLVQQPDRQQHASQQVKPLGRVGSHPHDRKDQRPATDDLNGRVHEQLRDPEHEQRDDGANRRDGELGQRQTRSSPKEQEKGPRDGPEDARPLLGDPRFAFHAPNRRYLGPGYQARVPYRYAAIPSPHGVRGTMARNRSIFMRASARPQVEERQSHPLSGG